MKYKVEHHMVSGWEDAGWMVEHRPQRFASVATGAQALREFIADQHRAVDAGFMNEKYDIRDWRLVPDTPELSKTSSEQCKRAVQAITEKLSHGFAINLSPDMRVRVAECIDTEFQSLRASNAEHVKLSLHDSIGRHTMSVKLERKRADYIALVKQAKALRGWIARLLASKRLGIGGKWRLLKVSPKSMDEIQVVMNDTMRFRH